MTQFIDLSGLGIISEENWAWVIRPIGIGPLLVGTPELNLTIFTPSIVSQETFGYHSVGNITLNSSIADANNTFGIPNISNTSSVPLISSQIYSQLPSFVREDHPHFINFMEAYYEWMENYRNVQFDIARLKTYQDVETSIDIFTEQFFKEFLTNIPRGIVADKENVLKNIREFYRAKGTEKSYKFFFRILFNIDVDFYYPRIDMLRVSDGKWIQPITLRIRSTVGNPFDLVGRRIRGLNNNASAFVEQVQFVQEGFLTVYELFLNRSSISGLFEGDEVIKAADVDIEGVIYPIVDSIKVVSGGEGYSTGDPILIGGPGVGATAVVQSVGSLGAIKKVKMTAFGAGYTSAPLVTAPGGTVVASLEAVIGAQTKYPGFFLNEDGQISASKYIQDGKYYQQFSYVVFVNESIEKYRDALKRMIHPAGLEMFGGFRSQELIDAGVNLSSRYGQVGTSMLRIHDHFKFVWVVFDINNQPLNVFDNEQLAIQWLKELGTLPYTEYLSTDYVVLDVNLKVLAVFASQIEAQDWLNDHESEYPGTLFHIKERIDTRFNSQYLQRRDSRQVNPFYFDPIDARIKSQQTELILIHDLYEGINQAKLGPSYRSIERDKFTYRPFEKTDITGELNGVNAGYWGIQGVFISQFANYQIKDFKDITVKEMTEKPWTKINIMPEPIVRNSDGTSINSLEKFGIAEISHT